jgi:feruloyl esterase
MGGAASCQVTITVSSESGPAFGYLPGQSEQINVRVGLPLSAADGGASGLQGAWNGKQLDLGGRGFSGSIYPVTPATDLGYVGTQTDTGHVAASPDDGSFALNPDLTLNRGLINDFARDGIHAQRVWGEKIATIYFGLKPARHYWSGCATGGRQGHYQAQNFPEDYDGILAGGSAFNWDRIMPALLWHDVVANELLGAGIAQEKVDAVTAAAIAACDPMDGVTDGILEDPRKCMFDAHTNSCAAPNAPASCLVPAEADAMNRIWHGPVAQASSSRDSGRAAHFFDRGTPIDAAIVPAELGSIATAYVNLWIHQDPTFDYRLAYKSSGKFFEDLSTSIAKFNNVIGTDDGLDAFRTHGGKMITYHGLFDPEIPARNTYSYYNRVAKDNYKDTQEFYRFFPYPNAGHCGGGSGPAIDDAVLLDALVNWVENGVAPDHIVAGQALSGGATRTRKVCKYPDVQVYSGSGSTDDQNNFTCQVRDKDDRFLLELDRLDRRFESSMEANPDFSADGRATAGP